MKQSIERDEATSGESHLPDLFSLCFNNAPIGIAVLNPRGQWLQVNEALCEIVGYGREELLQLTFQDITHPEDLAGDLGLVRELLDGIRDTYSLEKRYLQKDGQVVWAQLTATLVRDPEGTPQCFISHVVDITQNVRDRNKLKELTERLHLATEAAQIGVIDYDISRGAAFWDERMFNIYGLPIPEDGLIDVPTWMPSVHPEDVEELLNNLRTTITTASHLAMKYRILHPQTGERTLSVNARVVCDVTGTPIRCVGVTQDITEKEKADAELHAAKEAAESSSRAKSSFLAMMSHEIRTPLHGIIGYTDLLSDSVLSEKQQAHLSTIETSGEMLLTIIEDILDYSKIEAGKLALENVAFSLGQCVKESLEMLAPRAAAKGLSLKSSVAPDVPGMLLGDQVRLRQVLTNLLANAVKFTVQGEISLEVRSETLADGRAGVHFQISDSGIGIPQERIPELFQPFSQIDASDSRRFGGTGLGLAICRALVSSMGGQIYLTSRERVGTVAHVCIPFHPAPTATQTEELPLTFQPIPSQPSDTKFPTLGPKEARLRILIAEDNLINRRLIHQMLLRCGATKVELVKDGEEALMRLDEGDIDVVLMDCQMPRMDGFEATREIRRLESSDPLRARVLIIALTASVFDEARKHAYEVGMDDFLTKPLRPEALVNALSMVKPGSPG